MTRSCIDLTIQYDDVEIENMGTCEQCGEDNILDSSMKICFDCWCVLDIQEQEKQEEEE